MAGANAKAVLGQFVEASPVDRRQKDQALSGIAKAQDADLLALETLRKQLVASLPAAASAAEALRLARATSLGDKVSASVAEKLGISATALRAAVSASLVQLDVLSSTDSDLGAAMRVVGRPAKQTTNSPAPRLKQE